MKPAVALLLAACAVSPAAATELAGPPLDPPALNQRLVAAVEKAEGMSDGLSIRGLKKSLARNGSGYCGEASRGGGPYLPFHVLLDADGTSSVLLAPDGSKPNPLLTPADATRMLENFGCMGAGP